MQRQLIAWTKPLRYAIDSFLYRRAGQGGRLKELKGACEGRPMLVVGNGPSLNRTPLDAFAGVPSIGMNKIDMIFGRTTWRPTLIVCVNTLVAQQHQDAFAASDIPVYLAWKTRWFLRPQNRRKVSFFNVGNSGAFSTDLEDAFGNSATVTYSALQLAYWMGADPVVLVGVDHSFKFTGPVATYQKREGADENHFDPNYFKSGTAWGTPDLDQSEVDYKNARKAFEADGRRVFDATVDGKLTIFDRISIEKAIDLLREGDKVRATSPG